MKCLRVLPFVLGSLTLTVTSAAMARTSQKVSYNLFNPVPRDQMRTFDPDRPSITENPITVDAGHVQVESSFAEYAIDDEDGVRSETLDVLPTNLKLGLLSNLDVQLLATPYEREWIGSEGGSDEVLEGFADQTRLRFKLNLWGNDNPDNGPTGQSAFAIMPYVKIPAGSSDLSNDHWEAGLILPLQVQLPGEFELGMMAQFDALYAGDGDYGVDFVHSIMLEHDIPGINNLSGYVEYAGIAPDQLHEVYQAIGSAGLTYQVNDDWILDTGATVGLSNSAEDVRLFVGTSVRF